MDYPERNISRENLANSFKSGVEAVLVGSDMDYLGRQIEQFPISDIDGDLLDRLLKISDITSIGIDGVQVEKVSIVYDGDDDELVFFEPDYHVRLIKILEEAVIITEFSHQPDEQKPFSMRKIITPKTGDLKNQGHELARQARADSSKTRDLYDYLEIRDKERSTPEDALEAFVAIQDLLDSLSKQP